MKDVKYYNETQKEALEYTSKVIDFGVALSVYAALNELRNAIYEVMRSKHYRQTIKARTNNAMELCTNKITELKSLVTHKGFAETYWDAVVDASEEDINTLRREIKKTIDDAGIEGSEVYSEAETARVLLEAAKIHFEEVIKDSTNMFMTKNMVDMKDYNLFDTFHEFYVIRIYKEWNIVCDELYKNKNRDIALNNERTNAAFNTVARKFAQGEYVSGCHKVACEEYPEFSNTIVVVEE